MPSVRRAVYSALIGTYETMSLPAAPLGGGVDYILLTDNASTRVPNGWNRVLVDRELEFDSVRSARRLKILGHEVLAGYDETMWVDNRVILKTSPIPLFERLAEADIALPRHSYRKSLADEFAEVIDAGYDDPSRVRAMYRIAEARDLLSTAPLWTGLLLRRSSTAMNECMRQWFDFVLYTSRRDQLSIQAALADSHLRVNTLSLDNLGSAFHDWAPVNSIGRKRSIQWWRRDTDSFVIRLGDTVRSTRAGRVVNRGLARCGLGFPALPHSQKRTSA